MSHQKVLLLGSNSLFWEFREKLTFFFCSILCLFIVMKQQHLIMSGDIQIYVFQILALL